MSVLPLISYNSFSFVFLEKGTRDPIWKEILMLIWEMKQGFLSSLRGWMLLCKQKFLDIWKKSNPQMYCLADTE